MNRLAAAIKVDFITQWRNQLYKIGIGVGFLVAIVMAWLTPDSLMPRIVPSVMLVVIGGSTLMYVAGIFLFERDERTLAATIVSPLRASEYISAKIASLNLLSSIEAIVIVVGCLLIQKTFWQASIPNFIPILIGIVLLAMMYTLTGFILVVRYRSITEFLIPMALVASISQVPIFYFLEMIKHPILLTIPTSAPAMLIRGGYTELSPAQWAYAISYSMLVIAALAVWAHRAYLWHVVRRAG